MLENLSQTITVFAEQSGSHLQGIVVDKEREFLYCSFTTCLLKTDFAGNILGSVKGLVGHLGCIARDPRDGRVYGSLEFKHDAIGTPILKRIGYTEQVQDGFYVVRFDVDKIDRLDMDAEKDGIMEAVFLNEVYADYTAPGHRYGCSGIDGITFAPPFGDAGPANRLYIAYGIYEDSTRMDNDHQVLLQYDVSQWDRYAAPLDQKNMHRCGPEQPDGKYFVYTGNTRYGIQNLEYDPITESMIAAVYKGKKPQFPNYPMFFIDCSRKPKKENLRGVGEQGMVVPLTDLGSGICEGEVCGSQFPDGSTGIANLGNGYFYISQPLRNERGYGGVIKLYRLDPKNMTFTEVSADNH